MYPNLKLVRNLANLFFRLQNTKFPPPPPKCPPHRAAKFTSMTYNDMKEYKIN